MGELNADLTAVGSLVSLNDVSKLPYSLLLQNAGLMWQLNVEFTVQICLSEPVFLVVEAVSQALSWSQEFALQVLVILVNFGNSQWVEIGKQVAHRLEGVQKGSNLD